MTTSYCRHSPFLSRKEHRFSCFTLISFRMLTLCKKRTFRFIPVICKNCTILAENGITILAALWSALKLNKSQTYNSTLSCIPTYSILLSTIRLGQIIPLSLQRGEYVISFYFPLFKQSGINYPPTSSVPLSFKKGASFLMLSFNQLSHACPLQEENILLHSCNLQGLHGRLDY